MVAALQLLRFLGRDFAMLAPCTGEEAKTVRGILGPV